MKSFSHIISATLLVTTLVFLTSCDDGVLTSQHSTGTEYVISPGALFLEQSQIRMELNSSEILKAKYIWHGEESNDLTWTSSDPSVATVDNGGMVKGVGVGTATITVRSNADESFYEECKVFVINSNGHAYVDFGLYSGALWATEDVMGWTSDGEKSGYLFAWGEVNVKDQYTQSNYTYTDKPYFLPYDRDAARANWGGSWRMPTIDEFIELHNHFPNTTITTINGNKYAVWSNSQNESIMFLLTEEDSRNSPYSTYWTSIGYTYTHNANPPYDLDRPQYYTVGDGSEWFSNNAKYIGRRIRAVCTIPQNK